MGFNPRSPRGGATIKFVKSSIVLILFQSTLPTRGSDFNFRSFFKPDYGFNPRSPRGGATSTKSSIFLMASVSIHAPHEGERPSFFSLKPLLLEFQSTLPTRGSDRTGATSAAGISLFQSTLPTRGSDDYRGGLDRPLIMFQSTLPTRGSDINDPVSGHCNGCFNPRSPRGGATLQQDQGRQKQQAVSIHAPHEGERQGHPSRFGRKTRFQSTLPTRGSDGGKVHLYAAFPRIY